MVLFCNLIGIKLPVDIGTMSTSWSSRVSKKKIETEKMEHTRFTHFKAELERKREGSRDEKLELVLNETTA